MTRTEFLNKRRREWMRTNLQNKRSRRAHKENASQSSIPHLDVLLRSAGQIASEELISTRVSLIVKKYLHKRWGVSFRMRFLLFFV